MSDALLEVSGLQAWYGESHVLHGVDLTVGKGETVTLLGRNGAGKTTTLRTIMGILRKRTGSIRFKGHDLLGESLHMTARLGLGYIPEDRGIFAGLSVYENLMLPPQLGEMAMSVEEIYELFPNLKQRSSSPGNKLSGGEQQMLSIAKILRTGAEMLLLDEPTEGLAPVIVQSISDAVLLLKKRGLTVLLVEQNFRFARKVSDQFYVMENGGIVEHFNAADFGAHSDAVAQRLGV